MTAVPSTHRQSGLELVFLVAACTIAQGAGTVINVTLPSIAPAVAAAYGVPAYMIGYQVSVVYVGVILGLVFGANLSTRWGGCRTMQAALLLEAAGMLLASVPSRALLVPASLLMGFGYALLTPASSHLLMRFTPPARRNLVFSLKQTGVPMGAMFAAATAPALTLLAGWQASLWIYAGLTLGVIAVLQTRWRVWDDDRNPAVPLAAAPFTAIGLMWRNPLLRVLAFATALLACGQSIMQNYTVAMFYEQFNLSLVLAGFILGAAQVGGIVGRLFWGWVADRTRDCVLALQMLAGTLFAVAVLCTLLGPNWPIAGTALLFFVFGGTASGWHGAYLGEVARIAPREKVGAATSGALLIINVSAIITPLAFAGIYAAIHNYAYTFGMLAVPAAAALWLLWSARRLAGGFPRPAR